MIGCAPFAFQVVEGWNRDLATEIVQLHRSGRLLSGKGNGDGHSSFGENRYGENLYPLLSVESDMLCVADPLGPEAAACAVAMIRTALSRSDDEHMERLLMAHGALDAAARMEASFPIANGMVSAHSPIGALVPTFGVVKEFPGGWSSSMVKTPARADIPTAAKLLPSGHMLYLGKYGAMVHDVVPLDPMERLRLEAHLAHLTMQARSMEGIAT